MLAPHISSECFQLFYPATQVSFEAPNLSFELTNRPTNDLDGDLVEAEKLVVAVSGAIVESEIVRSLPNRCCFPLAAV